MSNINPFGTPKNPPWARQNVGNSNANLVNTTNSIQQQILNQSALNNINNSAMVPFQQQHQQQVFQNAMGLQQQNLSLGLQQMANNSVMGAGLGSQLGPNQIFQQVGAVTYPSPRALNPAFQSQNIGAVPPVQNNNANSTKQRVFTGTVTKIHDTFGFVDEDVFFQTSACVKGSNPLVGDRVLVEASYNPTMPFKWNATRIQVLPNSNQNSSSRSSNSSKHANSNTYNAVPPPLDGNNGSFSRNGQRSKASMGGRGRERSRERERDDEEVERKKRREERLREREKEDKKSPLRRRSRSPKSRRRTRIVPRYMVQIPKINLDMSGADVLEIRRRYANLYVPSDFFSTHFRWIDAFPADKPFTLNKPCCFHIMNKDVEPISENTAVLEPPDADYIFSAKVMLMSVPGMEEMYQKCCAMAEDREKRDRDSEERDYVHPTRLINFLVGVRGKNETMAIGGPWSPSLDGENPDKDPSVLIRTAIRTCKALTGIDLSNCTQWYRFVELYYRRGEGERKGKSVPARVEAVVLFLPDVWSCLPTRLEWDGLGQCFRRQLERRLKQEDDEQPPLDEKEEEPSGDRMEPTHYSQLDTKAMSVSALRNELKARNINSKGLKSQLVARLNKALKAEADKTEDGSKEKEKEANTEVELDVSVEEKKVETEEIKLDEKEKALLEKKYSLPEQPQIIVHPSKTAKSGKFDCTVMSLSLLLDYRPEDTKEHSFEVSLFAELFNEMLMRDFGFNIYKALYELPEKPKEKEEKKKKDDEKRSEDDKKKDDDKKKGDDDSKKKEDKDRDKDKEKRNEESTDNSKTKDDKKSEKRDEDKKRDSKKDDAIKKSDSEDYDDFEEDENKDKKKSDRDRRKRDRPKMFTKERNLLLSFIYFDQTHCGYIFEKDIEDLLYTLGLSLSRAQVRKLVGKVISRDSLHYRKLTDKPRDDLIVIDDSEKNTNVQALASGNKHLLPIFDKEPPAKKIKLDESIQGNDTPVKADDGLIMFQGALVDIAKLIAQLERSDKARTDTEARMVDLKTENTKLSEKNSKSSSSIKSLTNELKEYKEKLKISEENLSRTMACSKLFQATLTEIRDKIDPVLRSTRDNAERDRKHDEGRTRWEKDVKNEKIKEEHTDVKIEVKEEVE